MNINEKKCIFHIPNHIDEIGTSGSQIRPRKMLKAFQDIGYTVDVVMGYGTDRKKSIEKIKKNILSGVKYDFLYSESSTMPTLLTEKNHIPIYPFLDFGFLKFCKNHNIRIGLFYRDIYWQFPIYMVTVTGLKHFIAKIMYQYDLLQYNQLLNVLYLPSEKVSKYIPYKKLVSISKSLPPAIEVSQHLQDKNVYFDACKNLKIKNIELLYVGGIGDLYDILELLKGIKNLTMVNLKICCREKEWNDNILHYKDFLTERVSVVHKFGEDIISLYSKADICCCYFANNEYRNIAVPVKLFEYISYGIPVLASKGNPVGNFITSSHAGWAIDYDENAVNKLLVHLINNYDDIYNAHLSALKAIEGNRWIDRAKTVCSDLL